MKNKQVKQMICSGYFEKYGKKYQITHGRGFGLIWRMSFPVGNFFIVKEPNGQATPIVHFKVTSLTASRLKGE